MGAAEAKQAKAILTKNKAQKVLDDLGYESKEDAAVKAQIAAAEKQKQKQKPQQKQQKQRQMQQKQKQHPQMQNLKRMHLKRKKQPLRK